MSNQIGTYARRHHLGLIAIFIALSGTAYAVDGPLPGVDQVGSEDIINNEVRTKDVKNDGLTGADIDESTLGPVSAADTVDGIDGADLLSRGPSEEAPVDSPTDLRWRSYTADVLTSAEYDFGQISIATVGVANQFFVCTDAPTSVPFVAYVNGARSTGTVSSTSCSSVIDPGNGGDLRIIARGQQVFAHQVAEASRYWSVFGFGAS